MKAIILVGLTGSGKSTFCKKYPKFTRINQDELGSRQKCITALKTAISQKENIIIDRTNINKMQRNHFISILKEYPEYEINCIYFDADPELCVKRVSERENHPTITEDFSLDKIKEIVYSFYRSLEEPSISEGFSMILTIKVKDEESET